MKAYAKVIDEETKLCQVGLGTNAEFYKSIGMSEMDVEQAWDGGWYLTGFAPEKPAPTHEDINRMRVEYRKTHIDDKTLARMRKTANGTWTEEDEAEYLALDTEVTAYIEQNFPYPDENN